VRELADGLGLFPEPAGYCGAIEIELCNEKLSARDGAEVLRERAERCVGWVR
jgi:hypothetical protein